MLANASARAAGSSIFSRFLRLGKDLRSRFRFVDLRVPSGNSTQETYLRVGGDT